MFADPIKLHGKCRKMTPSCRKMIRDIWSKAAFFRCKLQIQFSQNNRIHPKLFRFMKTAVNLLSDKLFLYRSNLFSLLRHLFHWLLFNQNAITSLSLSLSQGCCVFEIILKALYGGGALADTVCAINKLYYAKSSYQIKEYSSDCTPEHNFCHAEKSCRQLKHDVNTVILGKCTNSHGPVAPSGSISRLFCYSRLCVLLLSDYIKNKVPKTFLLDHGLYRL